MSELYITRAEANRKFSATPGLCPDYYQMGLSRDWGDHATLATIDHRSRFQSAPKPTASAILQPATYWPIVSLMLSSPQCLDSPVSAELAR